MNEPMKNPLDLLLPVMLEAVQSWQKKNTPAAITRSVHERLNENRDEIVLKLLGFDNSYGDYYKLDHCNGRSGESVAGQFLHTVAKEAINSWLKDNFMPALTEEQLLSIKASMQQEYHSLLRRRLLEAVRAKVETDIKNAMDSISTSLTLDQHMKLMAMLQS